MQFKHLSILALASLVSAQDEGNSSQSLNATLASTEQLSNLTTFLGLVPAVAEALLSAEDITILAPSNDAFAEFLQTDLGQLAGNDTGLLAAVLQYHVLNGTFPASSITNTSAFVPTLLTNETYTNVTGGQVVQAVVVGEDVVFYSGLLQNSTVTQADVNFTGGVVHIIDRVLAYPPNVLDAANALNLTSFRGAVNATNSIEAANGNDVTIFAPNNEAFNSIGSALANLSSEDLASIIAYHVLDQVYYSTDLENGTSLQTLDGDNEIQITINDGSVFVNSAQVVTANVLIANGVLHIIDNVLNPDNDEPPSETATAGEPGFTGSAAAGQPFTSGQPAPTQTVDPTEEGPGPAETEASTETSGAAMPLMTGGVEYVALFGAGAAAWLGF